MVIVLYAVTVTFLLANVFIATLNELFNAASERLEREREGCVGGGKDRSAGESKGRDREVEEWEMGDPIDYMLSSLRAGWEKLAGTMGVRRVGPPRPRPRYIP